MFFPAVPDGAADERQHKCTYHQPSVRLDKRPQLAKEFEKRHSLLLFALEQIVAKDVEANKECAIALVQAKREGIAAVTVGIGIELEASLGSAHGLNVGILLA